MSAKTRRGITQGLLLLAPPLLISIALFAAGSLADTDRVFADTPVVDSLDPQAVNEGDILSITATFTDPVLHTHTSEIDWGDGSTSSSDSFNESGTSTPGTLSGTHTYADDGAYIVTVTVTDAAGSGSATSSVTVLNVAPEVGTTTDQTIDEGDTLDVAVAFIDPGSADTHSAVVDWGDGATSTGAVTEAGGNGTATSSHVYADNGAYTVTITVTDDDGDSGSATTSITVLNVAPTVVAGADQVILPGQTLDLNPATSTDPGFDGIPPATTTEGFTAIIDWGDGATSTGTVTKTPGGPGVETTATTTGSHVYASGGVYTVTVTVTDDDGGSGSASSTISVSSAPPDVTAVVITASDVRAVLPRGGGFTTIIGSTTFDLMQTQGLEQVLGAGPLPAGRYNAIRMTIESIIVTTAGEDVVASIPSGVLKFAGSVLIEAGATTTAVLAFEVSKSLILNLDGSITFKPVVKLRVSPPRVAAQRQVLHAGLLPPNPLDWLRNLLVAPSTDGTLEIAVTDDSAPAQAGPSPTPTPPEPLPIPGTTQWGLIALALLAGAVLMVRLRRRRPLATNDSG